MTLRKSLSRISTQKGLRRKSEDVFGLVGIAVEALSKQYVILPLSSFYRLTEEMDDFKGDVGVIGMSMRCGSTLMSQIASRIPHTRSLSEPQVLTTIYKLHFDGYIDMETQRRMVKSSLKFLCHAREGSNVDRVVIKLPPYASPQIQMMQDSFRQFNFFFITRHVTPSVESFTKLFAVFETGLFATFGIFWRVIARPVCFPYVEKYDQERNKLDTWFRKIPQQEVSALWWAGGICCYLECRKGMKQLILYEDLIADSKKIVAEFFDHMNIDVEHLEVALSALNQDSQNAIFNQSKKKASGEIREIIDGVLKRAGLPFSEEDSVDELRKALAIQK